MRSVLCHRERRLCSGESDFRGILALTRGFAETVVACRIVERNVIVQVSRGVVGDEADAFARA